MPDTLGTISIPDPIITSNVFPLSPLFPFTTLLAPSIASHLIDNTSANRKLTQRFYLGPNPRRWQFSLDLSRARRDALRNFWEARSGPHEAFLFNAPNPDQTTTQVTVTFADEPLSWQQLTNQIATTGITLIEFPTTNPSYTITSTQTRLPSGSLASALLGQVQELIPLIKLTVRESGYPVIYLSDRRCTISSQLYLARLLPQGWEGIEQSLDGSSDSARFTFGNADRVMKSLAAATDLYLASLEFSLLHVSTGIKLDIWKGDVLEVTGTATPAATFSCSDGLYNLGILYPRPITRSCYKRFNDGTECPYSTQGSLNLSYPSASALSCDKGFRTPNGCEAHNMNRYHGGVLAEPQLVHIKDNSTGVWGYSRNRITASSIIGDSVYEQALPEVFTDSDLPVPAKIIAGRDESDFYAALGIVCAGPVTFASNDFSASPQVTPHLLDGQPPHGANARPPVNNHGWRYAQGFDPALPQDYFSLGEGGSGPQTFANIHAAGVAFAEIRRSDEKGLQLSRVEEHAMQVTISQGLACWVWTAPGSRSAVAGCSNYVWIMINIMLRARGLYNASAATQELHFDVASAITAANICDLSVTKLVGTGTETQFRCQATIQERRAVREWLNDLCLACLGYYTFIFGKLKLGIRINSSAVESWTEGNILADSLDLTLPRPQFNDLTSVFANADFNYISDSQRIYHEDHVATYGRVEGQINLFGCTNRSQALRVSATRLREEIGGVTPAQYRSARHVSFRTTILGLHAEPGMVCSLTHTDAPNGAIEFRVDRIRLNPDFTVDISGRTTTDEMYDLTAGPKPADVEPSAIPAEAELAPDDWSYEAQTSQDGKLRITNLNCATNSGSVTRGHFSIYYCDESRQHFTHLLNNLDASDTSFQYAGDPLTQGSYILVRSEIMYVDSVTPTSSYNGTAIVIRGQLGTTAISHTAIGGTVATVSPTSNADFTISSGLAIEIGDNIVRVLPAGNSGIVAFYNPADGQVNSPLPLASLAPTNILSFQQRVYILSRRDEVIHFQPRFFKSAQRVNFEHIIDLPFAGVAAVVGILENLAGFLSPSFSRLYTTNFPHRLRTLGTTLYSFPYPSLPADITLDAFEPVRVVSAQSLTNASAEITGGSGVGEPLQSPGAPSGITPGDYTDGGQIVIGGTVAAGNQIFVTIGSGLERVFIQLPPFTITTQTTLVQVAEALRDLLNSTSEFTAYFAANGPTGSTVLITDVQGVGGVVATTVTGSITATPDGIDSQLGVLTGRRYAVSFRDTITPLESELSPLSVSTGPTGAATEITIRQVPTSGDSRVNARRIWATPDGSTSPNPPYYLVATISDNTSTEAVDTVTEATLTSQTQWTGSTQPTTAGAIKITIKRDGVGYCELRIDQNRAMSNVVHGLALGPLAEGEMLSADIDNGVGEVDLLVVVQ